MDNCMLEDELAERAIQKKNIAEKWEKYQLLSKNDDDPYTKLDLGLILENQRLFNEEISDQGDLAQWKRISIPLVMRIWRSLMLRKFCSVQPFFQRKDAFYTLEHEGNKTFMQKNEVEATDWKMKTAWSYEANQDGRRHSNLDYEAEMTAILAQEISLELDRRAFHTMRTKAGTNIAWDWNEALGDTIKEKYESLYVQLIDTARQVGLKTGRGDANWVVTSPEIASIFETSSTGTYYNDDDFTSSLGIRYACNIGNRFKVYKDPLFPTGQILMGYKGNHPYDCGYFWCPLVMLRQMPVVLDPDSFTPRRGLMTSDCHRLAPGGENFFATIKVVNFID